MHALRALNEDRQNRPAGYKAGSAHKEFRTCGAEATAEKVREADSPRTEVREVMTEIEGIRGAAEAMP
jgi:hypothetical protein